MLQLHSHSLIPMDMEREWAMNAVYDPFAPFPSAEVTGTRHPNQEIKPLLSKPCVPSFLLFHPQYGPEARATLRNVMPSPTVNQGDMPLTFCDGQDGEKKTGQDIHNSPSSLRLLDGNNELPVRTGQRGKDVGEEQLRRYLEKLSFYDSILAEVEKRIDSMVSHGSSKPEPLMTKRPLSHVIVNKEGAIRKHLFLSTFLVLLLSFFHIRYRVAKKKLALVSGQGRDPLKRPPRKKACSSQVEIDPSTVQAIESALDVWENQHGYLERDLNQRRLADTLKTNTTYLSKVINTCKGVTFSNYIKDLRVTHAINHLKEHPQLIRTHSTIQIAEMFGFNSEDVFVRALKAKIGLTPRVFFKKLKHKN